MEFNPFAWIADVWSRCYLFLTTHQIAGFSLWDIMFSIFIVGTLVEILRIGTGKKGGK